MMPTLRRSWTVLVIVVALGAMILGACGADGDEVADDATDEVADDVDPSPDDDRPESLNMLYATVEANVDAVDHVLSDFEEEFGITINMDSQPYDALQSRVFAELAGESDFYDIIIVDTPWTPALTDQLEPLSEYLENPDLNDHIDLQVDDFIGAVFHDTAVYKQDEPQLRFPGDIDTVDIAEIRDQGFEVFGLPVQANVLTMSYRADLFEDSDEQAAFEDEFGRPLEVPETWNEFVDVAQFFTRPDERLYGTTLMAGSGEWATTDFKTFLASFGGDGHLVTDDFETAFDSPEGVEALSFYRDLINEHQVTPPGTTTFSWDEAASTFGNGTTAMGMNYHTVSLDPGVEGEVLYAMVPREVTHGPHFGTWMLSVNKFSQNKEWAYRAAAWITSHDTQVKMLEKQLHPTRNSVYDVARDDPQIEEAFGNFYDALGDSLAVGVGRPRLTNYGEVSSAVAVEVNNAANLNKEPAQALSDAAERVRDLLREAGYPVD